MLWLHAQALGARVPYEALSASPGVTLGPQRVEGNIWELMQDLTETELGMSWVDAAGGLRSMTRADLGARPAPKMVLGCPHTPGQVDVVMQDLDPGNPAPLVVNHVIARRVGLDGQTDGTVAVSDNQSIGTYGQVTLKQVVRVPDDAGLTAWAGIVLARLASPRDWPRTVTVEVTDATAGQPWAAATVANVLALELGDVVTVADTHRGRIWTMLIAQISHELDPQRLFSEIKLMPHPGASAARYDDAVYNTNIGYGG